MTSRHLMAGEWIDPLTGQLRSVRDLVVCPHCQGSPISPKGYDCLTCFGAGRIDTTGPLTYNPDALLTAGVGMCQRCLAASLEPLCPSCEEMVQREMEAISFMPPSVVK